MTTTKVLATRFFDSNGVQPLLVTLEDSSTEALGGPITRETGEITQDFYNGLKDNHTIADGKDVYTMSYTPGGPLRLYKLFIDAQYLELSAAMTTGLPAAGETVTGGTSGATGTLIEDAYNGDTYIKFVPVSGTFQDNEALSFSTGSATPTTASSSALADNGGEYGVFYDVFVETGLEVNGSSGAQVTGFGMGINSLGNRCINLIFQDDSGDDFQWVSHDLVTDTTTLTEIEVAADASSSAGGSIVVDNVYYHCGLANNDDLQVVTVDLATGVSTSATYSTGNSSGNYRPGTFCEWNGRVFMAYTHGASYVGNYTLFEVTGGAFTVIDFSDDHGNAYFKKAWPNPGMIVGSDDNALYCIFIITNNTGATRAWDLFRYIIDPDDGTTVVRTCDDRGNYSQTASDNLGQHFLPAGITATFNYYDYRRFLVFHDNFSDDDKVIPRFWISDNSNTDPAYEFRYNEWDSLASGATLAWDGTDTITAAGVDLTGTLAVNDWIRHDATGKMFQITAISFSTDTTITAVNRGESGNSFPSTSSAGSTPALWSATSTAQSGLAGACFPCASKGGGELTYNTGDIAKPTYPEEVTYTANTLSLNFTIKENDALAGTKIVRVVGVKKNNTKTIFEPSACINTSTEASAGTVDAANKRVTGLAADTEYTISLNLANSGVANGEEYDIFVEVDFS